MIVEAQIDAQEGAPSSTSSRSGSSGEVSARRLRRRRNRGERYARALLPVALVTSAMGLGGLHWAALVASAAAALLAGFFAVRSLPGRKPYAPALVPLALAAYSLVQLIPLPLGVLRALSPQMVGVWEGALSPFGETLTWGSLSADPHATLVEALKWAAYAGAIAAAISVGTRRGVRYGALLLFGCAILVGTTTLLHGLLNVTRVYGIYIPTFNASRWHVGPFLNPNNLAGYLNLGTFCGVGLMVSRKPQIPRVVLGVGVAALVAVAVLGASRAGLGALVIGLFVFGALVVWVRRDEEITGRLSPLGLFAALGGVIGFAVLLTWLGSTDETWRALFDKNIEKIDVMRRTLPLVRDHVWFGVGRGAFEGVFPAYHFGAANVVYAHPENFIVEWVAEWGVPVAACALVAFAWVLWGAFRDARQSVTSAGVFAGVIAVLAQNMLDLGLELPGLAFATTTGLGVLWGHHEREALEGPASRRRHLAPRLLAWGVLGLGGALAVCVAAFARSNITKDRIRIHDTVARTQLRDPSQRAAARAALREAMLRHPADPYFPRAGGLLAWYARENPMPWMARSLERGMEIGQTHFALARMLASLGATNQALFELRLAATYAPQLSIRTAKVALSVTRNYDDLLRATPEGPVGQGFLHAVALNLKRGENTELRVRSLLGAVERYPSNVLTRTLLAEDLSHALASSTSALCAGENRAECERLVNEQIEVIRKLEPSTPAAVMTQAQYLMSTGRPAEAEGMLRKACQRFISQEFVQCQRRRVLVATATRSREVLDAASRDLAGAGCANARACGELYSFLGAQAESLGDVLRAIGYYKRAAAEEPTDARWSAVARTASAVGDHAAATNALSRLRRSRPDDREIERRLDQERQRLLLNGRR